MFQSRGITARVLSGIPAAGVISFLSRGCWTARVRRPVIQFLAGLTATLVLLVSRARNLPSNFRKS